VETYCSTFFSFKITVASFSISSYGTAISIGGKTFINLKYFTVLLINTSNKSPLMVQLQKS